MDRRQADDLDRYTMRYALTIDGQAHTLLDRGDETVLVWDETGDVVTAEHSSRLRIEAGDDEALDALAGAGFEFDDCRDE